MFGRNDLIKGQSAISNIYHNHALSFSFPLAQQPVHDRLAENQPAAGLSSLNEYDNGMGKSEIEQLNLSLKGTLRPKKNYVSRYMDWANMHHSGSVLCKHLL